MTHIKQFIVVEDPKGTFYEGSIVDSRRAAQLEAQGVTLLPVMPEMFELSGVGGYFRRSWGAGFPLDTPHPVMAAPMMLYCDPEHPGLHWRARIEPSEARALVMASGDGLYNGQGGLRIAADSGQRTPHSSRLMPVGPNVDVTKLGKPDARGGWTVGGRATIQCASAGHYGFALYGNALGLRVLWAAMSVTTDK